jgi:pSer/pThr/pTyr-binding forkhead associated (FHA) protein
MQLRLIVESGRTDTTSVCLRRFPATVGRRSDCNLRISSRLVSRRHCLIEERDGVLTVADLGSANGTFVNGQVVTERRPLRDGDLLEIGPLTLRVEYAAAVLAAAEDVPQFLAVEDTDP